MENMRKNLIVIFHCEFSQKRGPALWQSLREFDRRFNFDRYPKLCYPESYLLLKGVNCFSEEHPECFVGKYMRQEEGVPELNKKMTRQMKNARREYSVENQTKKLINKVNFQARSGNLF